MRGYSKAARVIAKVVPGRIVVSIPNSVTSEVINFEKVEAGRSQERGFTLTNPGGIAVPLEFHIPEPFRMLTNPGPQLGPLSSMNISVGIFPTSGAKGPVDVTMNIFGNEKTVPLRLLANVIPASGKLDERTREAIRLRPQICLRYRFSVPRQRRRIPAVLQSKTHRVRVDQERSGSKN